MKTLKLLGLSSIAILAAMAFIGAGSASATVLCKVNANPCTSTYPVPQKVTGSLKAGAIAKLTTSGGFVNPTIECKKSSVSGETTAAGTPLKGEIKSVTFTECTNTANGKACTVTMQNLNYPASIAATGGGNGTLTITDPTYVGAKIECVELPTCFYGAASVALDAKGGSPAEVIASNEALTQKSGSGFGCPTNAQWTATYTVTEPNPVFVI